MATRAYEYAESLSRSTTTSTTPQTKVTVPAFTPDANSAYLVVAQAIVDGSVASRSTRVQLQQDGTVVGFSDCQPEDNSPTAKQTAIAAYLLETGASPSSTTFTFKYYSETGGDTAGIQDATIFILKLEAGDEYSVSSGDSTTTTTYPTFVTKHTLAFTPSEEDDFMLLHFGEAYNTSNARAVFPSLYNNNTSTRLTFVRNNVRGATFNGFCAFVNGWQTLAASSQSISAQFCAHNTGTVHLRRSIIVALKRSNFEAGEIAYTDQSTTSTSFVESSGITFTPEPVPHWCLWHNSAWNNSTSFSTLTQNCKDGSSVQSVDGAFNAGDAAGWAGVQMGIQLVQTLAASSTTFTQKLKTQSAAATAYASPAGVAVLQLEAAASGATIPRKLSTIESVYGSCVGQELIG